MSNPNDISQSGKILVVDDEIEVITLFRDMLSKFGYDVAGCLSSTEALEALKGQDFDLLLADLLMPDIDGIRLLKAAKDIDPHIVGIIITGKGSIPTAVEAMKAGAFDYLLKPLDWEMLKPVLSLAMEVRRLRKSEEKYRSIVEDQTELICRFLPDRTLTFVNEVYCRYFNRKCEELIGYDFISFIPDEDREMVKKNLASLGPENPVITFEYRVLKQDGEVRWQQWTNRAIFDRQSNIIEFQAVARDVTDRKQAEEALRKSEEELKNRVTELEEFYNMAVGRELRMIELKEEIESLKEELRRHKKQ